MRTTVLILAAPLVALLSLGAEASDRKDPKLDRNTQAPGRQAGGIDAVRLKVGACQQPECMTADPGDLGRDQGLRFEHLTGFPPKTPLRATLCPCGAPSCSSSIEWRDSNPVDWGIILNGQGGRDQVVAYLRSKEEESRQQKVGPPIWRIQWSETQGATTGRLSWPVVMTSDARARQLQVSCPR